jgi:hypothetical protein
MTTATTESREAATKDMGVPQASWAYVSIPTKDHIDRRRVYKFSGHGIDDGARGNHRDAFGLLARALPDIAAQFTCRVNHLSNTRSLAL